MPDDKKKPGLMLAIGLGKPKPKDEGADVMDDSDADSEDFDSAANSAFDALKEDDKEGFKLALKAAVMACSEDY